MISINEQIDCVVRELGMRERLYPKWVAAGRMTQEKARQEIDTMFAVLETLKKIRDGK